MTLASLRSPCVSAAGNLPLTPRVERVIDWQAEFELALVTGLKAEAFGDREQPA
jgi:hypothetical protein